MGIDEVVGGRSKTIFLEKQTIRYFYYISLKVALKVMKYLGTNLTKYLQDLHNRNFKTFP